MENKKLVQNEINSGNLEKSISFWKIFETDPDTITILNQQEQILSQSKKDYHSGVVDYESKTRTRNKVSNTLNEILSSKDNINKSIESIIIEKSKSIASPTITITITAATLIAFLVWLFPGILVFLLIVFFGVVATFLLFKRIVDE